MATNAEPNRGRQLSRPSSGEALAELTLGLRFIALAVIAGSGALLLPGV